ncbi:MAG: DegT/DnrJ/EryC1/StrS family aminotransferase, partial [Melioribacteraceae bacterium]|nr:DegT/DnrJ/EryC1/StrS family aminotransferase [Melioribacteraceae bacterium]
MKVQRTLPPTAAPFRAVDILYGFAGLIFGKNYLIELNKEFQEYFGVEHVFFVSSGKAALTIVLKVLNTIDSRQEVIIPAYTCYSVPAAIKKAGLRIILCDINSDS